MVIVIYFFHFLLHCGLELMCSHSHSHHPNQLSNSQLWMMIVIYLLKIMTVIDITTLYIALTEIYTKDSWNLEKLSHQCVEMADKWS